MSKETLLSLLLLAPLASSTNYTYVVYNSDVGVFNKTFQSWSYGDVDVRAPAPSGLPSGNSFAISVGAGYSTGLEMHGSLVFEYGDIWELQFHVYGAGAGSGPQVVLQKGDGNTQAGQMVTLPSVPAGQWLGVTVPFHSFRNGTEPAATQQLNGIKIVIPPKTSDASDAALLFADIVLVARVPSAQLASVKVGGAPGRRVSPHLFGVNWGLSPFDDEPKWQSAYTTNRWGGNAVSRYAWDADIQNRASDWYFEDIPNKVANASALPSNSSSDRFIANTLGQKALPVVTIPTIGWAPKAERTKRCGFSTTKYGAQQQTDPEYSECGNGKALNGSDITGNDPTDTSRPVGPDYAVAWLDHLAHVFGEKIVTEEMLYIFGNEPNYWKSTHRDVHPQDLSYDELWNFTVAYGDALMKSHPGIKLMGPDIAGLPDLFTKTCGDDCKAHGSLPLVEWFIKQLGTYKKDKGAQLLQYLDIHCYPEGDHWGNGDAADISMRMRQTRELWDESFYAETWHVMRVGYLRRLRQLADEHAPWLKMSCTEYNYGIDSDIVDAVLTLDALAIYAREGVELATRWSVPSIDSITAYAYALLNDYDQKGGSIAGLAYLSAESSEPLLGAHAFAGNDGSPKAILLISRQYEGELVATVNLSSILAVTRLELYRVDSSHTSPGKPESLVVVQGVVSLPMPAISAALLIVPSQEYIV